MSDFVRNVSDLAERETRLLQRKTASYRLKIPYDSSKKEDKDRGVFSLRSGFNKYKFQINGPLSGLKKLRNGVSVNVVDENEVEDQKWIINIEMEFGAESNAGDEVRSILNQYNLFNSKSVAQFRFFSENLDREIDDEGSESSDA